MDFRTGLKKIDRGVLYFLRRMGTTGAFQYLPDHHNRILSYHSVGGTGYDNISQELFISHLQWLQNTYEIVDLPEVIGGSDEKKIAITFDDGYRSFYKIVYPIIHKYSLPVTVFVIGLSVAEPQELDPDRRYMTTDQLKEIAAEPLITVGSHTMSHADLSKIDCREELSNEINGGTKYLESELNVQIDRFCYPYNAWSEGARHVVTERHDYAVRGGGVRKFITDTTDPYLLPRIKGETSLSTLQYQVPDFSTHVITAKRSVFG